MKKLIMLVGVMVLAGIANAASVKWNTGAFTAGFADKDGNSLANSTAYSIIVSFYSDAKGSSLVTSSTQTKAKGNGAYNAQTDSTVYDFTAGTTYYASAIISDGSNELKSNLASFTMPDTGDANINFTLGTGFDTVANQWSSSGWQSVPEPTSALLMLLGFAGLTLKRKTV